MMGGLVRVNLSLPCEVPVRLGALDDTAHVGPIEERTDTCRTDAWWFVGSKPLCDRHLVLVFGDAVQEARDEMGAPNELEALSWAEAQRYEPHGASS